MLGANKDVYCYNLFAYCSNNPTNLTDPNGTFAGAIFGLIYAAATVVTTAVTSYAFGQSKPNTGITWEDVGNAIWNTIVFIVDPVGSTIRALNPPAVQSTQKEQVADRANTTPIVHSVPIRTGWPKLDKPRFPVAPELFHPNGLYRVVGRRLWDDYHLESSNFDPQKDLDEKLQCLLIIELLQDYGNPETRLPKLLPLIKSELPSVRNVLMSQLVPYLDEYMGHVIKAFEKLNIDNEFVTKIHWYFEKRSDAIDKRRSLKEMSPKYGYMIEYQEALKTQKQHWQQQMKKADENHKSLLSSMMKHVTLARGGGWRDENGKVQHLGCIQFSMPSRQLAQSMTPMEQDKWINDLLVDWNEKTGNN